MVLRHRYKRKRARIEMVPLIDIVFLLLVFFIYAMLSMAVHKGMKVDLPKAAKPEISEETPLSISVLDNNGISVVYINKDPVTLEELEKRLHLQMKEKEVNQVLLFADKSVSYQQLYKVLDRISSAGITAISLQAEASSVMYG